MSILSTTKTFDGHLVKVAHESKLLGCTMRVNVFLPPGGDGAQIASIPHLYFLAGLTCTEDNFMQKAGALRTAAALGLAIIAPDTSPRGVGIPGEDESWDFGSGAGFYVDATREPWSKHYRMRSYVAQELPRVINALFPALDERRVSICGHSMGGHGALTLFLSQPGRYQSVSAFAPIANPSKCPWGQKAFSGYLGDNEPASWKAYDATELVANYPQKTTILIDQGTEDQFWKDGQLLPEHFLAAAKRNPVVTVDYHARQGYDHGYYFIATFIDQHLHFHARALGLAAS